MATKPSTPALFDTNQTNSVVPSAGLISDGYADGATPLAKNFNYLLNLLGQWTAYLNDDTFDNLTVTGRTVYTGVFDYALTATINSLDPGANDVSDLHTINVTPDLAGWVIRGLVPGVDGQELQIVNTSSTLYMFLDNENVVATAAERFAAPPHLVAEDSGIIVMPLGAVRVRYVSAVSRWRVVRTSGCYFKTKVRVSPFAAYLYGSSNTKDVSGYITLQDTSVVIYPLQCPSPAIIDGFTLALNKTSAGPTYTIQAQLWRRNGQAAAGGLGTLQTTDADAPGDTYLEEDDLKVVVDTEQPSDHFWVSCGSPSVSPGADKMFNCDFFLWVPIS